MDEPETETKQHLGPKWTVRGPGAKEAHTGEDPSDRDEPSQSLRIALPDCGHHADHVDHDDDHEPRLLSTLCVILQVNGDCERDQQALPDGREQVAAREHVAGLTAEQEERRWSARIR